MAANNANANANATERNTMAKPTTATTIATTTAAETTVAAATTTATSNVMLAHYATMLPVVAAEVGVAFSRHCSRCTGWMAAKAWPAVVCGTATPPSLAPCLAHSSNCSQTMQRRRRCWNSSSSSRNKNKHKYTQWAAHTHIDTHTQAHTHVRGNKQSWIKLSARVHYFNATWRSRQRPQENNSEARA